MTSYSFQHHKKTGIFSHLFHSSFISQFSCQYSNRTRKVEGYLFHCKQIKIICNIRIYIQRKIIVGNKCDKRILLFMKKVLLKHNISHVMNQKSWPLLICQKKDLSPVTYSKHHLKEGKLESRVPKEPNVKYL